MSVSQVRLLVGDIPQRGRFEAVGDGVSTVFDLPEHPIFDVSERVTVDGAPLTRTTNYTIDYALGVLSLTAAPTYEQSLVVTYTWAQFTDANLQTLIDMEAGDARLAAADALDSIATNAALLQGRITMLDITLDGAAVAKILQDTAKQLRDFVTAGKAPDIVEEDYAGFDIAEMVFDTNAHEKVRAEILRGGL